MRLLVLLLAASAGTLSAAPWSIEWWHLTASDDTEPTASLVGDSTRRLILLGTTYGEVTEPAGEPPDVFRTVLNGKGGVKKQEQYGEARSQYFRGAVRSWLGNETMVVMDHHTGAWHVVSRTAQGKERWRLPMNTGHGMTSGLVRDFWGNCWLAGRPNNSSKPYAMSKIDRSGKVAWTREATGPDKFGMPFILRRTAGGDLVVGVWAANVAVTCYDKEMKPKWHTVLENKRGVPRDICFDAKGRVCVSTVFYEPGSDWHTKVWVLSQEGKVVGQARVAASSFSGWRVASDKAGHFYVAGMEYGETGYPLVIEFDGSLKEVGRFYVDKDSSVFIHSLQVSPDGTELTLAGSAYGRWMNQPTRGHADAYVVLCSRRDTSPPPVPLLKPLAKRPGVADYLQCPW